jgi:O-antigen ligase
MMRRGLLPRLLELSELFRAPSSFLTVPRLFFDYLLSLLVKDAYILPEWRIFDAVLVGWCIDGLIAAVLFFCSTAIRPRLRLWARRTVFLYFVGLAILIAGVVLGTWLRSHGI